MEVSGNELLKSIKSMRRFLADVGLLLKTADGLMQQAGWEARSEGCLEGASYSAGSGAKWIPREAVRWYGRDDRPEELVLIAVVLDDFEEEGYLKEPCVVAGICKLLKGAKRNVWNWQSHFFEWSEGTCDGKVLSFDDHDPDYKLSWGWSEMKMFGRALVAMSDEAKLKGEIVDPLLGLLRKPWGEKEA